MTQEDKDILRDFIHESNEAIERTELILLKLEDKIAGNDKIGEKEVDTIFRTFHSIKGSAGFIGLDKTSVLTHHAETLLDQIRKGRKKFSKKYIDIFLEVCDTLQLLMDHLNDRFTEKDFSADTDGLAERLKKMSEEKAGDQTAGNDRPNETVAPPERENSDNLITAEMQTQFVNESTELLDSLEQDLMALEKNSTDQSLIESAFRSMHSLKGNAGFFNYEDIAALTHRAESFLDLLRAGKAKATSKQISLVLQMLDFVRLAIEALRDGKPPLIPGKIGLLDLMSESFAGQEDGSQVDDSAGKDKSEQEVPDDFMSDVAKQIENAGLKNPTESINKGKSKSKANEVIRVDVEKLDHLLDLVGEIVIAESMVSHNPDLAGMELENFEKSINYLQKNIRELQDLATSMRMIPLSGIFGKMRRLVRDISAKKKNQVELNISGGETEVDRSVIEHISDPLVHILRNAIDHGIETPELRKKAGKNPAGAIKLEAKRVGGEIWIVIADDGAGLNRQKILKKAREKGLIGQNEEDLTDDKICNLIFKPGFSTAANVTSISGRGVGMDVVSKNIEKIRGRIDVASIEGEGTTIFLKIPLTTAIIDGMLMRVEDAVYAIPTLDIKESMQIDHSRTLDLMDGQEVVRVREQLIPVIRLQEIHQTGGDLKPLDEGIVVITGTQDKAVGFLVDEIIGQQQLVIKSLPRYLGKLQGVSGCAVMGNGDICLILDLATMVKLAESNEKLV